MLQYAMAGSWETKGLEGSRDPAMVNVSTTEHRGDHQYRASMPGLTRTESPFAATNRSNGTVKTSILLKRSRQDRDQDNDRSPSPPRRRSPRSSISPPNLRESFIPERNDRWYPRHDRRRDRTSRSPEPLRRRDRGDRWVPPSGRSSPPRRPSLTKLGSFEHAGRLTHLSRSPPPNTSRPGVDRWNSELREVQNFKNLTWKAPATESRLHSDAKNERVAHVNTNGSSPVTEDSFTRQTGEISSARIDFNGLKGVPTGPKQNLTPMSPDRAKPPIRTHPPLDSAVLQGPHIFIPALSLPTQFSITKHLHRFLRRYVSSESDVCFDDSGWYICFENTDTGRTLLKVCHKEFHQKLLFGQYCLHMHRFLNGQPVDGRERSANPSHTPASISVDTPNTRALSQTDANGDSFSRNLELSIHSEPTLESKDKSPPLADGSLRHLRYSSPALRVPSRHDKDETSSSISGITGSDMSVSKRLKCHVCQTNSGLDSDTLVHCSSCPRRYHRRCHTRSPIPLNLDQDHSWQCHRCVKKKIQPKSRLSNTSPAAASPAASVGQPEEPPRKKLRLDFTQRITSPDTEKISNGANPIFDDDAIYDESANAVRRAKVSTGGDRDSEDAYEPTDRPLVDSDETQLFEANDLVAKSFAPSVNKNQVTKSAVKPGRLSLLRKKLGQAVQVGKPESAANVEPNLPPHSVAQVASGESPSEETPLHPNDENDELKWYKKSHRWAGGGADKDIIQAGMDHLRRTEHSSLEKETDAEDDDLHTHEPTDYQEPDFTGDIALSKISGLTAAVKAPADERPLGFDLNKETISSSSHSTATNPREDLAQRSTATKQRMKPGAPAVAHCIKCQKTIAWQPSGTNKLCSRCKIQASRESTSHTTDATSRENENGRPEDRSGDIQQTTESIVSVQGNRTLFSKDTHLDIGTDDRVENSDRPPANAPKATKRGTGRTACELCRKRRRRCTHRSLNPAPLQDASTAEGLQASEAEASEDAGSEDDLNFWEAKPAPKITKPAGNDNSLSPYKNIQSAAEPEDDVDMDSDALSDAQSQSNRQVSADHSTRHATTSFQAKRKSQTRPAANEYDLGDSFSRPRDTYVKLIVMALGSAPNHRLKGNDIVQWVITNIPSYKAEHRKWQGALRATMTLKRRGYNGGAGLWKIVDENAKKNEGFVWELLPGVADDMLHWDPVLKKAVSPPSWRARPDSHGARIEAGAERERMRTEDLSESPVRSTKARRRQSDDGASRMGRAISRQNSSHIDDLTNPPAASVGRLRSMDGVIDSSDEEPIARRRKPKGTVAKALNASKAISAETGTDFVADPEEHLTSQEYFMIPKRHQVKRKLVPRQKIEGPKLTELIEIESRKIDYSAKSLYDEWPEYDPKNEFDTEAKIAEIKARPTRKQRFGKQDSAVEMDVKTPVSSYVFSGRSWSPDRARAVVRPTTYPWETGEENVVHCDSIEELFNLPVNPVAIIHNGELAYRDASKNVRVVYKTGYA